MSVCVQTPSILSWAAQDAAHNIYNTPNIFAIWGVEQITADLLQKGGLEAAGVRSRRRAQQVGGWGVELGLCVACGAGSYHPHMLKLALGHDGPRLRGPTSHT